MVKGFQAPTFCCIIAGLTSAASFVCVKGNIASVSCGVGATSVIKKVLQDLQWNLSPNIGY